LLLITRWNRIARNLEGATLSYSVVILQRAAFTFLLSFSASAAQPPSANVVVIDASKPAGHVVSHRLEMSGKSPTGHEIAVAENQYLTLDGKPWLPVMGEFHYSRYPEKYWEEELLKMKAGGVQIVATYLFWIHHEEIEGQFDWSDQRNLRTFVELCNKHGLYVFLRIGPFAHGEVRNGGLPDWVLAKGVTRRSDPQYLLSVQRYFAQIGTQVKGLLWKDGGPIIGVQLENEYFLHGPDAGAAHISELKKIARASGIEAPIYTVTGWGDTDFPAGEVIPVYGGYPDDFWESTLTELPPSAFYLFETLRDNGGVGGPTSAQPSVQKQEYPYFMAEGGGGMQVAYHRRPVITGDDVAAITLTRVGSGANLYGYYMYQGGANPDGKRTSLQESAETDHVYDLPKVSYDFQAPLGQFGEMRPGLRATKILHMFFHEFGTDLVTMSTVLPNEIPSGPEDRSTLRVAARARGQHAFVFLNNYQLHYGLPDHPGVQIKLALPSETIAFPRAPIGVPSGVYAIWPVNLDLDGVLLKYATAQPLTAVRDGNTETYFFFAQTGIPPEFAFDESTMQSVEAASAAVSHEHGRTYVNKIALGSGVAMRIKSKTGKTVQIVVLTRDQALNLWTHSGVHGDQVFLSPADVYFDHSAIHLRSTDVKNLGFSVFPELKNTPTGSAPLRSNGRDGVFASYLANVQQKRVSVRWEKIRAAAPSAPVRRGQYNAIAPTDSDFDKAAAWRIQLPADATDGLSDVFLEIDYVGDVGRLYAGPRLLDDDFYKGTPWEIGMKRFAAESVGKDLELKIMPLRKDAPIYIPASGWPVFPPSGEVADVSGIHALPEYEVRVDMKYPH